ncbi:two-component system sensor histidine kinase SenX3 [Naumannella cuiyingiana]|uniref:Sensor-like histidine kinase SenX3 n=1 Tax=Naumannella cuiyingiana TaxID=1347891 RepID=A0A7Z0DA51_9ACTN|nr:two-component system sensor histidine kinase SenX3 [Naumannella cuiyingiana]
MLYVLVGGACLLIGAVIGWYVSRRLAAIEAIETPPALLESPEPEVPDGVSEVLSILRSAAVVVGPHDEVLRSSALARTLGLVRGSRVAVPQLLEQVREVRATRAIRAIDLELSRGRGAPSQFLSVRTAPLGAELVVILAEDRTAARRVEETRRDFVANISHELKTPIGAIALLSEAVADAADDPEAVANFARRMQRESQRLGELVSQIIELSRLQADDPLLAADEVEVDDVLASAVDSCRVDADRRDVALTVTGRRGLVVLGDRVQLTTAIRNLVQNAVSYSDPGARVTVGARQALDGDDDVVDLTVSDNGIGIAPGEAQRIFERFYRVDYARSRDNGGTGLGLSIVKHIAAAHGGQVTVWSKVGQGSTFTVRIPAITDSGVASAESAPRADEPPVGTPPSGEIRQSDEEPAVPRPLVDSTNQEANR